MIKVVLFGARGRMGKMVTDEFADNSDIILVAGVERPDHPDFGGEFGGVPLLADGVELPEADVWLDFSLAGPALEHARRSAELGMPLVIAATGFDGRALQEIERLSERAPMLLAPNLSVGIGAMDRIVGEAAGLLGADFDPAIVELHHRDKRDAPSGTALRLAERVSAGNCEPMVASIRAGGALGEHRVMFVGKFEELVITHRAYSRRAFSRGAVRAVSFIVRRKPGLYSIRDMFDDLEATVGGGDP